MAHSIGPHEFQFCRQPIPHTGLGDTVYNISKHVKQINISDDFTGQRRQKHCKSAIDFYRTHGRMSNQMTWTTFFGLGPRRCAVGEISLRSWDPTAGFIWVERELTRREDEMGEGRPRRGGRRAERKWKVETGNSDPPNRLKSLVRHRASAISSVCNGSTALTATRYRLF